MPNAVLVIDMVRGFCEPGYPLYVGETIRQIIPRIQHTLDRELKKDAHVFFICDSHSLDDLEFKMFPPHCIAGTEQAEVIPELKRYPGQVIRKKRFSGFYGTDLAERLDRLKPEKLIVVGDCTNICVFFTVADARNRDYEVEVPADCVATFDPEAHTHALDQMEKVLGARVLRSAAEAG
ncbi:MAG: cysteine hydrolase [Chloroflexi bacterium]|nr:cysteine hydrolase [Chloroflexota bacterium]